MGFGIMKQSVESIPWQDYRASNIGMVVFYTSDPVSEMPVREIPEEIDSAILPEPNYENRVFGLFGCIRPKIRQAFVKSKLRYLFFLTKYAGCKEEYKDKFIITGYFRIYKSADVQKLHLRYVKDSACIETDSCIALRADEVRFVSLQDSFLVNDEQLKAWGYNAKINRQLRIVLDAEKTSLLLEYLKSKPDQTEAYIAETKRLQPHEEAEEVEEPAEYLPIEPTESTESVPAPEIGEGTKEPEPIDIAETIQASEETAIEEIKEQDSDNLQEPLELLEETKAEGITDETLAPREDNKEAPSSNPQGG